MPNNEDSNPLVPCSDANLDVMASPPEEPVLTLQWGYINSVNSVAFSPDGR
ncbi:MAG TPA: hypothetical protein PKK84_01115 [Armatimonadota bacterium]|jgi:hypothetical protein|nr:hypothetical protein [Armatimonadota bacterium]